MASLSSKAATSLSLGQKIWNSLSAWTIRNSGYQKLGLRREDLYDDDYDDVKEAIRRLPETELNLRTYRIKRALDLTLKHSILPREQWTKAEEDIMYLKPFLEEVVKETNLQNVVFFCLVWFLSWYFWTFFRYGCMSSKPQCKMQCLLFSPPPMDKIETMHAENYRQSNYAGPDSYNMYDINYTLI